MNMTIMTISCLLCLFLFACSGREAETEVEAQENHETPELPRETSLMAEEAVSEKARGLREAKADILAGHPRLMTIGLPRFEIGDVDDVTGLPYSNLGCDVTVEACAYEEAYNAEVTRALKAGELKGMTYKNQIMTAEDAKSILKSHGHDLAYDSQGFVSPNGKYRVSIVSNTDSNATGHHGDVFVEEIATKKRNEVGFCFGKLRMAFAHDGATAIISGSFASNTYDLSTGVFMQGFEK